MSGIRFLKSECCPIKREKTDKLSLSILFLLQFYIKQFVRATLTKYNKVGDLSNRHLFVHSSEV
jgi:hypothetical protein